MLYRRLLQPQSLRANKSVIHVEPVNRDLLKFGFWSLVRGYRLSNVETGKVLICTT